MSVQLTAEQIQVLEREWPARVVDPRTGATYLLTPDTSGELQLAAQTRMNLLPRLPDTDGYQFFAHCEPALDVGGDFCDCFPLPNGSWAILIGDVAGKGLSAALLMGRVNSDARLCILTKDSLQDAISALNRLVIALAAERFVTMIAALLDPSSHQLTLVNAGHVPALRYRKETRTVREVIGREQSGIPLGVEDVPYTAVTTELKAGDCIIMITDGGHGGNEYEEGAIWA